MMAVRRCSDCGQTERLTEFTQNKGTTWYHRRCKPCRARRAWEQKHPGERYEDWLHRRADEAEGRVARPRPPSRTCTGCGEDKPLDAFVQIRGRRRGVVYGACASRREPGRP